MNSLPMLSQNYLKIHFDNSQNSLCDGCIYIHVYLSGPTYLPSNDQTLSFDDLIRWTPSVHHNDISGCPSDIPPILASYSRGIAVI